MIHHSTATLLKTGQIKRVDVALSELLPQYSRSQLSAWLKQGFILIEQKRLKPKDRVIGGEKVELNLPSLINNQDLPEAIELDIVFEDPSLLIINKPARLVVHPGVGNLNHTLVNALLHYHAPLAELPRAGIIHRLDKDTTGLLLVAKNLFSYQALVKQMSNRLIQRQYLALVHGRVFQANTIQTFYGRHPKNRLKMTVLKHGKEAITHYDIERRYNYFTLLKLQLRTGRTHQIRVHCDYINHPIVGDKLYGRSLSYLLPKLSALEAELLTQMPRQTLHALSLTLNHPLDNTLISVQAPIPHDFNQLLNVLLYA